MVAVLASVALLAVANKRLVIVDGHTCAVVSAQIDGAGVVHELTVVAIVARWTLTAVHVRQGLARHACGAVEARLGRAVVDLELAVGAGVAAEALALVAVGLAEAGAVVAWTRHAVVDALLAADAREAELAAACVADGRGHASGAVEAGIAGAEVVQELARLAVVGLRADAAELAIAQVLARAAIGAR